MILIAEGDSRVALATEELRELVAQLGERSRAMWARLVSAAREESSDPTMAKSLLLRIRNSSAFHYDQKALSRAYDQHFESGLEREDPAAHMTAQYSFGRTMEESRFYFADAAAQRVMLQLGDEHNTPKADQSLVTLAGEVNEAIGPLLAAFIARRSSR